LGQLQEVEHGDVPDAGHQPRPRLLEGLRVRGAIHRRGGEEAQQGLAPLPGRKLQTVGVGVGAVDPLRAVREDEHEVVGAVLDLALDAEAAKPREGPAGEAVGGGARPEAEGHVGLLLREGAGRGEGCAQATTAVGRARDDVLSLLEDRHGYEVHSVAHKGDRVEDMAYSSGQLTKLVRALEKLIARGTPPKAVLLSGGGNDVAGDELA